MKTLALLIFICGCTWNPQPEPDTETVADPVVDAGPSGCEAACTNLAALGCAGAEGSPGPDEEYGTPDDVPCAQVCEEVEAEGISMETACTAAAQTCSDANTCLN